MEAISALKTLQQSPQAAGTVYALPTGTGGTVDVSIHFLQTCSATGFAEAGVFARPRERRCVSTACSAGQGGA